jgi:pimeloyl-ACP methyl ester carboxylesterase
MAARDLARRHVEVHGIDLAYVDEGDGPAVLLLHGWPDSADLWRHQVPALVAAGHRVVAPDLRGFGDSARPEDVSAYGILEVVGDANALLDHLGIERCAVVGHDWGAMFAWVLGTFGAPRVERLTVVSVGHPGSFAAAGIRQRQLSFYMTIFQFPEIGEQWLRNDGWRNLRDWVTVGGHAAPDLDRWVEDLSRPGALTASLGPYRANVPPESLVAGAIELPPVTVPTMGIMGTADFALTVEQMAGSAAHVSGEWRYEALEGKGHWLPVECPDEITRLLVEWHA